MCYSSQSYRRLMLDESHEYENRITEFIAFLKDTPNTHIYNNLGVAYLETGKKDKGLDSLNNAINLDNSNWIAYLNRAEYFTRTNFLLEAESDYSKAIEIMPNEQTCRINRAHFYRKNHKLKEALLDFKEANKINPEFEPVKKQIAEIESTLKNS